MISFEPFLNDIKNKLSPAASRGFLFVEENMVLLLTFYGVCAIIVVM